VRGPKDRVREKIAEVQDLSRMLNAATKTIELMGQVVRNFAGSLDGVKKLELTRECYLLGLRGAQAVVDHVRANCSDVLRGLENALSRSGLGLPEAKAKAPQVVFWLMEAMCHGMFGMVADAVGLQILGEVYGDIERDEASLSVEFMDLRVHLEHFDCFPESKVAQVEAKTRKNHFARTLLRLAVWEHFFLCRENYKVKQRMCTLLDIGMKSLPALRSTRS